MEAKKYYFLDFAHKEAGVSSFFILRPKYSRVFFWAKSHFELFVRCPNFGEGRGGLLSVFLKRLVDQHRYLECIKLKAFQILLPVERLDRFEELQPNFKGILDEKGRYLPGFDLKTRWRHSENQMMGGKWVEFV